MPNFALNSIVKALYTYVFVMQHHSTYKMAQIHTSHAVTGIKYVKNDKPHGSAPTINNIAGSEHVAHALQKSQYHPALESMGLTVINYLTQTCMSG